MYQKKKYYILLLAFAFIIPMGVMGAWKLPTVAPPTASVVTPINASNNYQQKGGSLAIGGELGAVTKISSPQFCIITSWSEGNPPPTVDCTRIDPVTHMGLGWKSVVEDFGITKIIAGEGMAVTPSPGEVTISSTGGDSFWVADGVDGLDIKNTNSGTVVVDTIQIKGGNPAAGKILVSDAEGNASWETK